MFDRLCNECYDWNAVELLVGLICPLIFRAFFDQPIER